MEGSFLKLLPVQMSSWCSLKVQYSRASYFTSGFMFCIWDIDLQSSTCLQSEQKSKTDFNTAESNPVLLINWQFLTDYLLYLDKIIERGPEGDFFPLIITA